MLNCVRCRTIEQILRSPQAARPLPVPQKNGAGFPGLPRIRTQGVADHLPRYVELHAPRKLAERAGATSVGRPALLVIHGHPAAKAIQNTLSFGSQLSTSPTSDLASNPSRNAGLLVGTSGLTLGLGTGCLSAKTIRRDVLGSPIRHATGLEEGWEVRPLRSFGIRSSTVPARVSQSRSR